MSTEEVKDQVDQEELGLMGQFESQEESYEEAVARAAEEDVSFTNIPVFSMQKLGTYAVRILPLAPAKNAADNRKSYEWPLHAFWANVTPPVDKNGKVRKDRSIKVPRLDYTSLGVDVDLINTFRKLAVAEANENNDEKLAKKINEGSYSGGLKYTYEHAMFVFDMDEREKGVQQLNLSHAQFKELEEAKFKMWKKLIAKDAKSPCPISSLYRAYPVEIDKKKDNDKTKYTITIDNMSEYVPLKEADMAAILKAPRVTEIIYRYSRFHFEATLEFLKQYQTKHDLHVLDTEEMKEAIQKVEDALPKDDQSHFSWDKKDNKDGEGDAQGGENETLTLDVLYDTYDQLVAKNLGDKTPEGQNLRSQILSFIEEEGLGVQATRRTTNIDLLEACEKEMQPGIGNKSENTDK